MLDPFDKSRCSFPVPDFASEEEEYAWSMSLTPEQRFELLHLMQIERWGEHVLNAGIDRTVFQSLTMEEFDQLKATEDAVVDEWRRKNGYPPRFRASNNLPTLDR